MIKKENSKVIISNKRKICSEIVEFVLDTRKAECALDKFQEINNYINATEEELKFDCKEDECSLEGYIIDIKNKFKKKTLQEICMTIEAELFKEDSIEVSISSLARNLSRLHFDRSKIEKVKSNTDDNPTLFPDYSETLKLRKKGNHLSFYERWSIYKLIKIEKQTAESINTQYNVSRSTINNIMDEFGSGKDRCNSKLSKHASKLLHSKAIQELIREYVCNTTGSYCLGDVLKYIKVKCGIEAQKHQLRNFMKDRMRFSYKKGGNRPAHLNIDFQNSLKCLFGIRFIHNLSKGCVLINIDESVISKNTRINYSWLPKGTSYPITNMKFNNSISLISAICSNGFSLSALVKGTNNSEIFLKFLERMIKELQVNCDICIHRCMILLDNCSIHKSKLITDYLKKCKAKVYFIIPYSPELAPIEMFFSKVKSQFYKDCKQPNMNLKSEKALCLIKDVINRLDCDFIKGYWRHFISEIKNCLVWTDTYLFDKF